MIKKEYIGQSGENKFQVGFYFSESAFEAYKSKPGNPTDEEISNLIKQGSENNIEVFILPGNYMYLLKPSMWETEIYTRIMPKDTPLALEIFKVVYESLRKEKDYSNNKKDFSIFDEYKKNPPSFKEFCEEELKKKKESKEEVADTPTDNPNVKEHTLNFNILNADVKVKLAYDINDAKHFFDMNNRPVFEDYVIKRITVSIKCETSATRFNVEESFRDNCIIDKVPEVVGKYLPKDGVYKVFVTQWSNMYLDWITGLYNSFKDKAPKEKPFEEVILEEKRKEFRKYDIHRRIQELLDLHNDALKLKDKVAQISSNYDTSDSYRKMKIREAREDLREQLIKNQSEFIRALNILEKLYR